eukprot:Awhi_evm1s13874
MGFQERADAFDFNASLGDHYRWEKQEEKLRLESANNKDQGPKKDYTMKEGESFSISFGNKTEKKAKSSNS